MRPYTGLLTLPWDKCPIVMIILSCRFSKIQVMVDLTSFGALGQCLSTPILIVLRMRACAVLHAVSYLGLKPKGLTALTV